MAEAPGTCGECCGALRAIRVVEQDHQKHYMLKYAAVDSLPPLRSQFVRRIFKS